MYTEADYRDECARLVATKTALEHSGMFGMAAWYPTTPSVGIGGRYYDRRTWMLLHEADVVRCDHGED